MEVIDFALNTLNPVEGPQLTASTVAIPVGYMKSKPASSHSQVIHYDQIVFHTSSANDPGKFFEILSVDPTSLVLTAHTGVRYDAAFHALMPIEVGNFDNRQPIRRIQARHSLIRIPDRVHVL